MIRHLFKLIWNRKRANCLMITEIFVSFLVLFAVRQARSSIGRQLAAAARLRVATTSGIGASTSDDRRREFRSQQEVGARG